jgi:hypothetical protein
MKWIQWIKRPENDEKTLKAALMNQQLKIEIVRHGSEVKQEV